MTRRELFAMFAALPLVGKVAQAVTRKGFLVTPGVTVREIDKSTYIPNSPEVCSAIAGTDSTPLSPLRSGRSWAASSNWATSCYNINIYRQMICRVPGLRDAIYDSKEFGDVTKRLQGLVDVHHSDDVGDCWFAPAGIGRGNIYPWKASLRDDMAVLLMRFITDGQLCMQRDTNHSVRYIDPRERRTWPLSIPGTILQGYNLGLIRNMGYLPGPISSKPFTDGPWEGPLHLMIPAYKGWFWADVHYRKGGPVQRVAEGPRGGYMLWDIEANREMYGKQMVDAARNWDWAAIEEQVATFVRRIQGIRPHRGAHHSFAGPRRTV